MVQFHTCIAYRRCFCPNALASTSSKMNARHVMTRHIVWLSGKRITSSGLDAIFEDSISTSKLADHYSSSWKERQSAKWGIGCVTNDGSQPCADDPTQSTLTKRNYYVRAVLWKQLTRDQWHYHRFSESGPSLHQNWTCPLVWNWLSSAHSTGWKKNTSRQCHCDMYQLRSVGSSIKLCFRKSRGS